VASKPADAATKARALELYAAVGPAEASRQTGIPQNTISQWASRTGVSVTRGEQLPARIEAARQTLAQRRLALADLLLDDASRLREQLWVPAESHHWGQKTFMDENSGKPTFSMPVMATETISQPLFNDQKNILVAAAVAVDKSQLLSGEATERTEQLDPTEAREKLAKALGRAHLRVVPQPESDVA
jgi:hypothetical protein